MPGYLKEIVYSKLQFVIELSETFL